MDNNESLERRLRRRERELVAIRRITVALHATTNMEQLVRQALDTSIEETRLELNMIKDARSRIMRRALGANFNMNQLLRKIHCFELPPRLLTFTWAASSSSSVT